MASRTRQVQPPGAAELVAQPFLGRVHDQALAGRIEHQAADLDEAPQAAAGDLAGVQLDALALAQEGDAVQDRLRSHDASVPQAALSLA
jgi:hypothetical protein